MNQPELAPSYPEEKDGRRREIVRLDDHQRQLVEENWPYVDSLAEPYKQKVFGSDIEYEDILQAGYVGLIQAASRFAPHHPGVKFSTYAYPRIIGAIQDFLRERDPLPREYRAKWRLWFRTENRLIQELGRFPTVTEIATDSNIDETEMQDIFQKFRESKSISLEEPRQYHYRNGDMEEVSLHETLEDRNTTSETTIVDSLGITSLLRNHLVSEREREVLNLYFFSEFTLKEIGEVLGITESRVSQIRQQALSKLALISGEMEGL